MTCAVVENYVTYEGTGRVVVWL